MKLFISDLDGTLLNHASKLKPRTKDMLNYLISTGVLFSYATARSFETANPIMKEININIPVITMNGVIIADGKTGVPIIKNFPDEAVNRQIQDSLLELGEFPLVFAFIDGKPRVSYLESRKKHVKYYLDMRKGDKRFRPCRTTEEMFEGQVYYYCIISPQNEKNVLDKKIKSISGVSVIYQEDYPGCGVYWYEIFSDKATKANAIHQLKEYTGASELVCFGDNVNDIEMLRVADIGCAVKNAFDEVKKAADTVIGGNESYGVPYYIEQETVKIHKYNSKNETFVKPDNERFSKACEQALGREISTIATLNEKNLHSALKHYFAPEISQEAKIGNFYADAVTENGIIEIQSGSFGRLNTKLGAFLQASHVTVVYPFRKIIHNMYIHNATGELIKASPKRKMIDMTKFFLELYRIKTYLTNPNLTICIAELEIEKARFVEDERCIRKKGQKIDMIPLSVVREIYLEKPSDYSVFLPDNLPGEFTVSEFGKYCKNCQPKLMLDILEYMMVVERIGKSGNGFVYRVSL